MKRVFSHHTTYLFKFLLPIVMTFVFFWEFTYIVSAFYQSGNAPYTSNHTPIWIVCGGLLLYCYAVGIRLKKISLDRNILYVSNFRSEIKVSINDIKAVYTFFYPYFILIRLSEKTNFGSNIFFLPISWSTCLELKSEVTNSTSRSVKEHSEREEKEEKKYKKRYLSLLLTFLCCVFIFFVLHIVNN